MAFAALALLAGPAQAQGPEDLYAGPGYGIGGFWLSPTITIDNVYDSNIRATERNERDDYHVSVVPGIEIQSTWLRHFVSLKAFGEIHRYAAETSENHEEYTVEARGRLDLSDESSLGTVFRHGLQTVGRTNAENDQQSDPQQLYFYEGQLRYDRELVRLGLSLRGFARRLDFRKTVDNDRDRLHVGTRPRLAYRFSPAFSLFVEPGAEVRDYDQRRDDDGFERSSVTSSGYLGSEFDIAQIMRGELGVGFMHMHFDDSRFDDETIPSLVGELTWELTTLTRLDLDVAHRLAPTTREGASSKSKTRASLQARHELRRNLFLNAEATFFREDFNKISRKDDNFRFRVGATYVLNRFLSIDLGYRLRIRDSNVRNRDFLKNVVNLSIATAL